VRMSSYIRETQRKAGNECGGRLWGSRHHLYGRGGRGDGTVKEKRSMVSEVIQFFHFMEKRGRGITYFKRGKEHARWLLVSAHRGDRMMQWCAAAAGNRSRTTSGLTRGGRQPLRPVTPKCCLGRILLWRLNRLPK
jgi:hypothetical protein